MLDSLVLHAPDWAASAAVILLPIASVRGRRVTSIFDWGYMVVLVSTCLIALGAIWQ